MTRQRRRKYVSRKETLASLQLMTIKDTADFIGKGREWLRRIVEHYRETGEMTHGLPKPYLLGPRLIRFKEIEVIAWKEAYDRDHKVHEDIHMRGTELADLLGIDKQQLYNWVSRFKEKGSFPDRIKSLPKPQMREGLNVWVREEIERWFKEEFKPEMLDGVRIITGKEYHRQIKPKPNIPSHLKGTLAELCLTVDPIPSSEYRDITKPEVSHGEGSRAKGAQRKKRKSSYAEWSV